MPYVNIPESNLAGGVANIVGKMTGNLSEKIATQATTMVQQLRSRALQNTSPKSRRVLQQLRNKHNKLSSNVNKINRRVNKFNKMAKTLAVAITGLEVALKIILAIPVPQAFPHVYVGPPGLPVNVSTKYADLLHKIKELIKQLKDNIAAIILICQLPNLILPFLLRQLQRMDNAITAIETRIAIEEELEKKRIKALELQDIGLLLPDGDFIFSKLGPIFIEDEKDNSKACNLVTIKSLKLPPFFEEGKYDKEIRQYTFNSKELRKELTSAEKAQLVKLNGLSLQYDDEFKRWKCYSNEDAVKELNNSLDKLNSSNLSDTVKDNIKKILNRLQDANTTGDPTKFLHRGPNGTLYTLEIVQDLDSPGIAPKHFAIAKDPSGVTVLRGPKSFSSDVDVLIDEIKFRIDNQLP